MLKKVLFIVIMAVITLGIQSFITEIQTQITEKSSPVHWYTFSEAVALQKKEPRMIMVDVYTDWCGPCKMMSANTFGNPIIANYLNTKFYPVKFNAETRDSVAFNGVVFKNNNALDVQRPVHDFAASILDGKMVYPSIVFLNEEIKRVQVLTGYHKADQFEPIITFFGSNIYKDSTYEAFQKTFIPQIK
ncbi:MAG: DUF255 domain-containing protein [Bacteroidia bacterium]